MAKWIDIEDRLPKYGTSVLVDTRDGDYIKMEYTGSVPKEWWERNVIRWLDETNVCFTLGDMEDAFFEGKNGYYSYSNYMKEEYNIDIK